MINFPSSPTLDQEYSFGGRVWKYNGTGWALKIDAVALTTGDITSALGYAPVDPGTLATVATTGSYNDLLDKPTAVSQVNSDWDATSGVEEILNKPTLGTAAATDVEDYATAAQGTLADTAVQPASTDTLTNKVIDSITNQIGADHIHLKVQASEAIAKGNVVKVTGYNSGENALRVGKVSSAADVAVGIAHDDIANGDFGAIINTGVLEGINTSAFTVGTILYPNTSGGLTSTAPASGAYQALAYVIRSQTNNGAILIEASEPNFTRATANTANTLVQRDSSGNFSAGTITASALVNSGPTTLSGGTANGVAYLDGSKVLTTGSALTYNGSAMQLNAASFPALKFGDSGATLKGEIYYGIGGNDLNIVNYVNGPIGFSINSAEQMRLTSTGLGIGTSSPAAKLNVDSGSAGLMSVFDSTNANGGYFLGRSSGTVVWDFGTAKQTLNVGGATDLGINVRSGFMAFGTGTTERMRLDSSGNLGLGGTPSAWNTFKAIEVGSAGVGLYGFNGFSAVGLAMNTYYNSGWKYGQSSRKAARYDIDGDANHAWFTAPSGTAGNAISFTQAMTLTAAGELLVGKTSPAAFTVQGIELRPDAFYATRENNAAGHFSRRGSNGDVVIFLRDTTTVGSVSVTTTATTYNTSSDYRLKNITGPIANSGAYIDSLNPVEGTWKVDGSTFVGLIAHEVQEASRTTVATGTKDGEQMQGMDYSSAEIIANMLAELKSLRARVQALESN